MKHKNENRPGYKKTKVGWIPEGWREVRIGDLGKVITGNTPPKKEPLNYGSEYCWATAEDFTDKYIRDTRLKLSEQGIKQARLLPEDSVLVTCIASIGLNGIAKVPLATNQQINSIIVNDSHSNEFVYYLIQKNKSTLQLMAGSGAVPILSKGNFEKIEMGFPPLPEQEAIAEVLECWDKGIRTLENKIVKKRLIKNGLMQKLLSGKIRLPGFSKPWETVELGEVLTEHKEYSSGCEEVHSVSVHKGVVNQVEHLGRSFSAKDTSNYNLVKPGDIIYTKSPTGDFPSGIIKQSKLTENVIVSPLYGVFTPLTYHLGVMLDAFFDSPVNTGNYLRPIIQKGAKNTINITNTTFLKGKMKLPLDKDEQGAIAEVLSAADKEIEALEQKLALWKEQKKYLLNNLVTGTIRLPQFIKNSPQKSTRSA